MRQRVEATEQNDAPGGAAPARKSLHEFQKLGLLYGALNHLAPLVRLCAIASIMFGQSGAVRSVLAPVAGAIVASLAHGPLAKVIAPTPPAGADESSGESSASAQGRAVVRQALRLALLGTGAGLGLLRFDAAACGLQFGPGSTVEIACGGAASVLMGLVWSLVGARMPRERLVVDTSGAP